MTSASQIEQVHALALAIHRSGLSSSAYARTVLVRDPRTIRRWLAGHAPIPKSVLEYLAKNGESQPQEGTTPDAHVGANIGVSE